MRVKLKTKFGQFWDRKLRWGITAGEVKDLPEPLPQDTLTYQKLRVGGFEIIHDVAAVTVAPASEPEYSASISENPASVPENDLEPTATQTEPETERLAETPVPPEPKPLTKKRGRPKRAK